MEMFLDFYFISLKNNQPNDHRPNCQPKLWFPLTRLIYICFMNTLLRGLCVTDTQWCWVLNEEWRPLRPYIVQGNWVLSALIESKNRWKSKCGWFLFYSFICNLIQNVLEKVTRISNRFIINWKIRNWIFLFTLVDYTIFFSNLKLNFRCQKERQ